MVLPDQNSGTASPCRRREILGISFLVGSPDEIVREIQAGGGYVVVPAATAIVNLESDPDYREALTRADFAITDSGAMVLLWLIFRGEKLPRVSGLRYLKLLLQLPVVHAPGKTFWIVPNPTAQDKALAWLPKHGIPTGERDCYAAPFYGQNPIEDPVLLERIELQRPANIIIGLGGGVQERLGLYLRERLSYRPAIHCIGAALGFLTGDQNPIPDIVDRLYLGWFLRWCSQPRQFTRRLWNAHRLPGLIARFGEKLPPLKTGATKK